MDKFQISLAAARVNAGLTQEEVAKAMKVGKQTIVSWEKGNSEPKMSQSRELKDSAGLYFFTHKIKLKLIPKEVERRWDMLQRMPKSTMIEFLTKKKFITVLIARELF